MQLTLAIQGVITTIVYLGLMIFCLTQAKTKGIAFLGTAFGLIFFSTLCWIIFPRFMHIFGGYSIMYTVLGLINIVTILGFAVFFILGILQFKGSLGRTDNSSTQIHQSTNPAPHQKFGNVGFYASMLIIGLTLMLIGIVALIFAERSYGSETVLIIMGIITFVGFIVLTIAEIYFFVLLYRVWKFAINESHRHNLAPSIDAPGKAVGFLFIPFFNLYWMFLAYGKLPKDLNAIARAKNIDGPVSEGLGITLPIFCLLCGIPFLGYIISIVVAILSIIFISSSINLCKKMCGMSPPVPESN